MQNQKVNLPIDIYFIATTMRVLDNICEQPTIADRKARTANKGFAIAGVPCFADTFVQGGSSVLRMKLSAKIPRHRKPPKRCAQAVRTK